MLPALGGAENLKHIPSCLEGVYRFVGETMSGVQKGHSSTKGGVSVTWPGQQGVKRRLGLEAWIHIPGLPLTP